MHGRRGVSLREQLNIRHRSNLTWIKRVSLPSLTPQLVFLISSFLSWFHLKMRFPRKTPSASAPRHFCVLRFGGPRRNDASDTCGACNVLNQTRGQTSQSVVFRKEGKRERETVGTFPRKRHNSVLPLEPFARLQEERENALWRLLMFCASKASSPSSSEGQQRQPSKTIIDFGELEERKVDRKKQTTTTHHRVFHRSKRPGLDELRAVPLHEYYWSSSEE